MERKNMKFVVGSLLIVGAVIWLGASGFQEGKSYYKTADEAIKMGSEAVGMRMKVAGQVVKGSVIQAGRDLSFKVQNQGVVVPVTYIGSAPIPDTFNDEAQAVVEGTFNSQGVFEAKTIQAKCASKYESEYKKANDSNT